MYSIIAIHSLLFALFTFSFHTKIGCWLFSQRNKEYKNAHYCLEVYEWVTKQLALSILFLANNTTNNDKVNQHSGLLFPGTTIHCRPPEQNSFVTYQNLPITLHSINIEVFFYFVYSSGISTKFLPSQKNVPNTSSVIWVESGNKIIGNKIQKSQLSLFSFKMFYLKSHYLLHFF